MNVFSPEITMFSDSMYSSQEMASDIDPQALPVQVFPPNLELSELGSEHSLTPWQYLRDLASSGLQKAKASFSSILGNQRSQLEQTLGEWVMQGSLSEQRQAAADAILACYDQESRTLDLSDLSLSSLPDVFETLTHLQELDISENNLREFPDSLWSLDQLQILDMSDNQLTSIPNAIAQCRSLQMLDLHDNKLEELPPGIGRLTNLRVLDVYQNSLEDLPNSMQSMQQLQVLDLYGNELRVVPTCVRHLSQLKEIDLSENLLERDSITADCFPESLIKISLEGNEIDSASATERQIQTQLANKRVESRTSGFMDHKMDELEEEDDVLIAESTLVQEESAFESEKVTLWIQDRLGLGLDAPEKTKSNPVKTMDVPLELNSIYAMVQSKQLTIQQGMDYALFLQDRALVKEFLKTPEQLNVSQIQRAQSLLINQESIVGLRLAFYFAKTGQYALCQSLVEKYTHVTSDENIYVYILYALLRKDTQALKILQKKLGKSYPEYLNKAQAYYHTEWLRHIMGIDSKIYVPDPLGDFEMDELGVLEPELSEQFFLEALKEIDHQLPDDIAQAYSDLCNSTLSIQSRLSKIQSGKPVIFEAGFEGHIVYIAFYRGYMMKINRGLGSEEMGHGIHIYKYNSAKLSPEILAKVAQRHEGIGYFQSGIDQDLDLQTLHRLAMKPQVHQNCGTTSLKGTILALLAIKELDETGVIQNSKLQYKRITTALRKQALSHHLPELRQSPYCDPKFAEQVAQKAAKKFG